VWFTCVFVLHVNDFLYLLPDDTLKKPPGRSPDVMFAKKKCVVIVSK
jgi:hypothetical protein